MFPNNHAHIIVVGNEKGGAGKTTTCINIISHLLYDNHSVSSVDIDYRQRSLTTFIENRKRTILSHEVPLPVSSHFIVNKSKFTDPTQATEDEEARFLRCLDAAAYESDYIVIDAPGHDNVLSRIAHSYADTLITPINDSFIDFSVLADINPETYDIERSGVYSEMVWEAKKQRLIRDRHEIDWVVLRNRLTNLDAKNKRNVTTALGKLSKRLGCRIAEGFSERVIFRELFLRGLSLLDVLNDRIDITPQMSHLAARQELRDFMEVLALEPHIPDANQTTATLNPAVSDPAVPSALPESTSDFGDIALGYLDDDEEHFSLDELSDHVEPAHIGQTDDALAMNEFIDDPEAPIMDEPLPTDAIHSPHLNQTDENDDIDEIINVSTDPLQDVS